MFTAKIQGNIYKPHIFKIKHNEAEVLDLYYLVSHNGLYQAVRLQWYDDNYTAFFKTKVLIFLMDNKPKGKWVYIIHELESNLVEILYKYLKKTSEVDARPCIEIIEKPIDIQ